MVEPSCNFFLSDALREHYDKHGVKGVESYVRKKSQKIESVHQQAGKKEGEEQKEEGVRYIRLNPRYDAKETLALLEEEIKNQSTNKRPLLVKLTWMPAVLGYYAIPDSFSLTKSVAYRSGRIYGMDVSSGAAVAALLLDDDTNGMENTAVEVTSSASCCNNTHRTSVMRILDLCCAPGLKTCAMMDILSTAMNGRAHFVGVDISEKRMQLCKNVIQKYHMDPDTCGTKQRCFLNDTTVTAKDSTSDITIQLFRTDGTTFGMKKYQERDLNALVFDSSVTLELMKSSGNRKRMNKSAKAREQKRLKAIMAKNRFDRPQSLEAALAVSPVPTATYLDKECMTSSSTTASTFKFDKDELMQEARDQQEIIIPLFDRVLVDAECSTDGAIRHLRHKYKKLSMENSNHNNIEENSKLTDSMQLRELVELQKQLISSGFRLLRPGGIMVYSTCSLSQEQNEDVVSWLLKEYGESVEILPFLTSIWDETSVPGHLEQESLLLGMSKNNITEGGIQGTIRFHPSIQNERINGCSGFFLAKLRKIKTAS
jgi:16S rRNA C967 or C1407 C5-methylase (RsmB/RsmF family)